MLAWLEFFERHFNTILLALMGLGAWFGTLHLMNMKGMDPSNVAWAREQTATVLGALLGLLTGYKIGVAVAAEQTVKAEKNKAKEDTDAPVS
jgi:hypothetical protein